MKLYLTFSGEGPTDQRFIQIIVERIIKEFLIERQIEAEFSWIVVRKSGSSHDNILKACSEAKDYQLVVFHRDSGNLSWNQAYENHFSSAVSSIKNDNNNQYNKNLIPVIPIREIEAWMLCNKELLKSKIETNLSNSNLGLIYITSRIESIGDPKSVIQNAIDMHNQTLTPKQKRYAVRMVDLYDLVAADISIDDLNILSSFVRFKNKLDEILTYIVA